MEGGITLDESEADEGETTGDKSGEMKEVSELWGKTRSGKGSIDEETSVREWKGNTSSWKTTSLDTKIYLVVTSYSLYPLMPVGYPIKTHILALGWNLCLWDVRVEAKAKQPKTLKRE